MTTRSWQLKRGDLLMGTLTLAGVDMFWTDCRFEPASAWETVRPLFEASHDAWERGDEDSALAADEAIAEAGFVLVPGDGGAAITDFLLRVSGKNARFRS
ncbi:hypothetical protein HUT18_02190 [Streptomyces sp. NA04227]|uniref:hypothetical protein n=1 Tax=Streptomyces sp. NA04227 TaxID=2742136 RepID=UPI0015901BB4|nr:hypothetical protein [Streptomyces sp. NA04227]QKW05361.1 hypothetical protein HUT18_02190 [Streptomyces sp. NA04227]